LYEFNEAVKGFLRNEEREQWRTRELIWTIIQWAPFFDPKDKPKKISDIFRLNMDGEKKETKKKVTKITEQEIKIFEMLNYNGPRK
jgi:predicted GTPase